MGDRNGDSLRKALRNVRKIADSVPTGSDRVTAGRALDAIFMEVDRALTVDAGLGKSVWARQKGKRGASLCSGQ